MKVKRFIESVEEKEYSEEERVLISFLNQVFGHYVKVELLYIDYDIVGYDLHYRGDDTWDVYYMGTKTFTIVEDGKFYDLDQIINRKYLMDLISNNNVKVAAALKEKIKDDIV